MALKKIINDSLATIEAAITSKGLDFPSPRMAMTIQSEEARMLPEVDKACSLIVSAATQLACTVRPPLHVLVSATLQVRELVATSRYKVTEALAACCACSVGGGHYGTRG